MLITSPYTYLFSHDKKRYLYNSLSEFYSEISEEFYNLLKDREWESIPTEVKKELINKKVLINSDEQDVFFYDSKIRFLTSCYSPEIISLVIAPTTGCNFECPYCFEPKTNPKSITKEVKEQIITYINKQENAKKLNLTWYGGEPLLMLADMKELHKRIVNETKKEITAHSIITNGYLLNEEAIDFIEQGKVDHLQVTLDGTESTHNSQRFLKISHKPTYHVIKHNIEQTAKRLPKIRITIRVNINKKNYMEFVEVFNEYNQFDWQKNIFVYPGIIKEDTPDKCSLCHSSYSNGELLELYEMLSREGVNVNFMPGRSHKGCMLQRTSAFIIGPEGELYKCWNNVGDSTKVIGSIMDNEKRNYTLLMSYMNETSPFESECMKCKVFPICDGGCGYLRYRNKHENANFDYCSPLKERQKLEKALILSQSAPLRKGKHITI